MRHPRTNVHALTLELSTATCGTPTAALTETDASGSENVQFSGPREWVQAMRLEWYAGVPYTRVTIETVTA